MATPVSLASRNSRLLLLSCTAYRQSCALSGVPTGVEANWAYLHVLLATIITAAVMRATTHTPQLIWAIGQSAAVWATDYQFNGDAASGNPDRGKIQASANKLVNSIGGWRGSVPHNEGAPSYTSIRKLCCLLLPPAA